MSFYIFLDITEDDGVVVCGFGSYGVFLLPGNGASFYDIFCQSIVDSCIWWQYVVIEVINIVIIYLLSIYQAYHCSSFESSFGGRWIGIYTLEAEINGIFCLCANAYGGYTGDTETICQFLVYNFGGTGWTNIGQ